MGALGFALSGLFAGEAEAAPQRTKKLPLGAVVRDGEVWVPAVRPKGKQPCPQSNLVFIPGEENTPLVSDNPDGIIYPASLTKLATAAVVFEQIELGNISLDTPVPITVTSKRDTKYNYNSGVRGFIKMEEALALMLGMSYNDVAESIAQRIAGLEIYKDTLIENGFVPGSADAFCKYFIKKKTEELGMNSSRFLNAHGLPPYETTMLVRQGHQEDFYNVSTASDMAKLYTHLITTYPEYMRFTGMPKFYNPGKKIEENNTNPLLASSESKKAKPVPGVIGGKTGTSRRGLNLGALIETGIEVLGELLPVQAVILTFGNTTPAKRIQEGQRLITEGLNTLTSRFKRQRELVQSFFPAGLD